MIKNEKNQAKKVERKQEEDASGKQKSFMMINRAKKELKNEKVGKIENLRISRKTSKNQKTKQRGIIKHTIILLATTLASLIHTKTPKIPQNQIEEKPKNPLKISPPGSSSAQTQPKTPSTIDPDSINRHNLVENLMYVRWEKRKIFYQKEYLKYKTDIEIEPDHQASRLHYSIQPIINKKFNLSSQCWLEARPFQGLQSATTSETAPNPPPNHPKAPQNSPNSANSTTSVKLKENVYENKLDLIFTFQGITRLTEVTLSNNTFNSTRVIYESNPKVQKRNKDSCVTSEYDTWSKILFSLCYNQRTSYIYISRINFDGGVRTKPPIIRIIFTKDENFIKSFNLLVIPSGNNEYSRLIVYSSQWMSFWSIYASIKQVSSKNAINFGMQIFKMRYYSNAILIITKRTGPGGAAAVPPGTNITEISESSKFANYYIRLKITDTLDEKKPIYFCAGVIKNSYISKRSKSLVMEVFSQEEITVAEIRQRVDLAEKEGIDPNRLQMVDKLNYYRYYYDEIDNRFHLLDYTNFQDFEKSNPYFYEAIQHADVVRVSHYSLIIVNYVRFQSQEQFWESAKNRSNPGEIKQKIMITDQNSKYSAWLDLGYGAEGVVEVENRGEKFFSSFDKEVLFEMFRGTPELVGASGRRRRCRILMRMVYDPYVYVHYNLHLKEKDDDRDDTPGDNSLSGAEAGLETAGNRQISPKNPKMGGVENRLKSPKNGTNARKLSSNSSNTTTNPNGTSSMMNLTVYNTQTQNPKNPKKSKKQRIKKYKIKFIDDLYRHHNKYTIFRGSSLKNLLLYSKQIPESPVKYFARGSFIHQIIDLKQYTNYTTEYRNNLIDYRTLYKQNRSFYDLILSYSFFDISSLNIQFSLFHGEIEHFYILSYHSVRLSRDITTAFMKMKNSKVSSIYSFNDQNRVLEKMSDFDVETITKIIPWSKGNLVILDKGGYVYLVNIDLNTFTSLDSVDKSCSDMSLFIHSSFQLTLLCLNNDFDLGVYRMSALEVNGKGQALVTSKASINPEINILAGLKKRILYTPVHQNKLFLVAEGVDFGKNNIIYIDVKVEEVMILEYKKLLRMPPAIAFDSSTKIVDCVVVEDTFVQLLVKNYRIYVCVFKFDAEEEVFEPGKCYSLPSDYKLLPGARFLVMKQDLSSGPYFKPVESHLSLQVMDIDSRGFNTIVINPHAPYMDTAPFFLYPISSKNFYQNFQFIRISDEMYDLSICNLHYNNGSKIFQTAVIDLVEFDQPSINIDPKDYQELTHSNILSLESRLNTTHTLSFVSEFKKQDLFKQASLWAYEMLDPLEVPGVLNINVTLSQYLPEVIFRPKIDPKTNISFFAENKTVDMDEVIASTWKNSSNFKTKFQLKILDLSVVDKVIGDIFKIDIKSQYGVEFVLKSLAVNNTYQKIKSGLRVSSPKGRYGNIRFKSICVKTKDKYTPNPVCISSIYLYIDPEKIIGFENLKNWQSDQSIDTVPHKFKFLSLDSNCTLGDTYKYFYLQICEEAGAKFLIVVDFELVTEERHELNLDLFLLADIRLQVIEDYLKVMVRVNGNYIEYFELYRLEVFISEKTGVMIDFGFHQVNRRRLGLTNIRSMPIIANDVFVNSNQKNVSFGVGSQGRLIVSQREVTVGFVDCATLTRCTFSISFVAKFSQNFTQNPGDFEPKKASEESRMVIDYEESYDIYLDSSLSELIRAMYRGVRLADIFQNAFKNPNLTSFLVHFPNSDDFLVYGEGTEFYSMMRIRLSNPFKGLITSSSLRPICKGSYCVVASVFKNTTYLRLYFLDWEWINSLNVSQINLAGADLGRFFTSTDASEAMTDIQSLRWNYTIWTYSVINFTGEVTQMEWADNSTLTNPEFYLKTAQNEVSYFRIGQKFQFLSDSLYVNSRFFDLIFVGREGRNLSVRFSIADVHEEYLKIYFWHLVVVVIISFLVSLVVCAFLSKQSREIRDRDKIIFELQRKIRGVGMGVDFGAEIGVSEGGEGEDGVEGGEGGGREGIGGGFGVGSGRSGGVGENGDFGDLGFEGYEEELMAAQEDGGSVSESKDAFSSMVGTEYRFLDGKGQNVDLEDFDQFSPSSGDGEEGSDPRSADSSFGYSDLAENSQNDENRENGNFVKNGVNLTRESIVMLQRDEESLRAQTERSKRAKKGQKLKNGRKKKNGKKGKKRRKLSKKKADLEEDGRQVGRERPLEESLVLQNVSGSRIRYDFSEGLGGSDASEEDLEAGNSHDEGAGRAGKGQRESRG